MAEVRYYLLCRHGRHRSGNLVQAGEGTAAEYPTAAIGARLGETLRDSTGPERIVVAAMVYAETAEARETADLLRQAIYGGSGGGRTAAEACKLEPADYLVSGTSVADTKGVIAKLRDAPAGRPGNAVVAVGHQPQLSWIADELLNRSRRGRRRSPPTPIDHSGVVCIDAAVGRRGRLCWAISYDDSEVIKEVRDKIQRKMDTAKLLSGAVAFGLTASFGILLDGDKIRSLGDRAWTVRASSLALLLAGLLYFATMYAYDSLLMPARFWGERQPSRHRPRRWLVARPPSSAAWILYQNMMRIWRNLFTVASVLVGVGIALLGYGALRLNPWAALAGAGGLLILSAAWIWWSRPILGSED